MPYFSVLNGLPTTLSLAGFCAAYPLRIASSVVTASIRLSSSCDTHSEYVLNSEMFESSVSFWSRTRCSGVEPVAEQTFLPCRVSLPVIEVSSARTSRSWPAMKYGPAKPTSALRLSVIEYVPT